MDVEALRSSPIGELVPIMVPKPGSMEATESYWAYVPDPLVDSPQLSMQALDTATRAAMALARLDQAVAQLPNPQLIVRPIIRKEATSTSALEGTYAEFDQVLEADFIDQKNMSSELREITNFVRATEVAATAVATRPLARRLIGELQAIIVKDTDGDTYDAGDLRQRQVYIGPKNRPVEEARFIPTPNGDSLVKGFSDWEKWINAENRVPIVVKMALGHYQFETLHPYADGNGRIGRLVAVLQLMEAGVLETPCLNIAPWFESRKQEYQDGLLRVTHTGDLSAWVDFFSRGVLEQAEAGVRAIRALLNYKDETIAALRGEGIRGAAIEIAENLIGYPVLDVAAAKDICGRSYETANQAISRLVEAGVLEEITGKPVNRLFVCRPVMHMVHGIQV